MLVHKYCDKLPLSRKFLVAYVVTRNLNRGLNEPARVSGVFLQAEDRDKISHCAPPPSIPPEMSHLSRSVLMEAPLKPWMFEFSPPKHQVLVKYGSKTNTTSPLRTIQALKQRKQVQQITRVTRAKEKSVEYILRRSPGTHSNPLTMRGWMGLVEDRMERAKAMGHFTNIRGRGKPLQSDTQDSNPFVSREEFFMNRIIKRNGAAPPWVELQTESEKAVESFRGMLQAAWVRRAARMLTLDGQFNVSTTSVAQLNSLRDREWEQRERSFHNVALQEVNSLLRNYNNIAPYTVRRSYLELTSELERVYQSSGDVIMHKILSSMTETSGHQRSRSGSTRQISRIHHSSNDGGDRLQSMKLKDIILQFWRAFRDRDS